MSKYYNFNDISSQEELYDSNILRKRYEILTDDELNLIILHGEYKYRNIKDCLTPGTGKANLYDRNNEYKKYFIDIGEYANTEQYESISIECIKVLIDYDINIISKFILNKKIFEELFLYALDKCKTLEDVNDLCKYGPEGSYAYSAELIEATKNKVKFIIATS